MSDVPALSVALAALLGIAAALLARLLLAYVARRDPSEALAFLPPRGAALLWAAVLVAVLALLWGRPLTPASGVWAAWAAALAVIFTVDLRVRYILDVFTAPLAALAVLAAIFVGRPPLLLALIGAGVGLAIFALFFGVGLLVFGRPAIGFGDVKLAALLGLMVGGERILTAVFIGALLGGVISLALVATGRAKLGDAPAYGTYLALGGYAALLQLAGAWR